MAEQTETGIDFENQEKHTQKTLRKKIQNYIMLNYAAQ